MHSCFQLTGRNPPVQCPPCRDHVPLSYPKRIPLHDDTHHTPPNIGLRFFRGGGGNAGNGRHESSGNLQNTMGGSTCERGSSSSSERLYLGATRILQCCVRSLGSRRTQPVDPILKMGPDSGSDSEFFLKMGTRFGFWFHNFSNRYWFRWNPAKLNKKKAPKKGRDEKTRGKEQSLGKETAQKGWATRRKGNP